MKSVTAFAAEIGPLIRDTTNGTVEVSTIKSSLNRGIRTLIGEYGIYATKDKAEIAIFPSVYEYPLPSNFDEAITLRTPGIAQDFSRTTPDEFWRNISNSDKVFSVDYQKELDFLLVKYAQSGQTQLLNACDSLTNNGTWAAEGSTDAQNVTIDTLNYKSGGGALSFDVSVSLSGNNYAGVQNSTMTAVDLTSYSGKGTGLVWVYIPSITNLTSFTLRWGSDSSNYYSQTVTTQYNGLALRNGWNRLGFRWSTATTTGSPTVTAIDYLLFRATYTASYSSQTGFLVDDIRFDNPTYMELSYYSNEFVKDASGNYQQYFEDDSDQSMLDDSDDDVLLYYALMDSAMIKEDMNLKAEAEKKFNKALALVKGRFQSEKKKEVKIYY